MTDPSATASRDPSTLFISATTTGTIDSAPGSSSNPTTSNTNDNDDQNTVPAGMTSYYFVFLMLVLGVVGLVIFLNFRRRRHRRLHQLYGREANDYQTTSGGSGARGRRYWRTGWGSRNASREEGLNEMGEAPPPYVPKRDAQDGGGEGPAVPMQTLSRDQVGLSKPPDYEEARAGEEADVMRPSQRYGSGGSSSQQPPTT